MPTVLVTGGNGVLGRRLVPMLRAAGHRVTVGTRSPGGPGEAGLDLATGQGIAAAVAGQQVVVHAASDVRRPMRVDAQGSQRLATAAAAAGVGHLVYISIVGVDVHPLRYYRAKLAAEQAIEAAGVPYTILRTTQFHDLVTRIVDAQRRLPQVIVPKVPFQVVETAAVARRIAALVAAGPSGRVPDLGGPAARPLPELARTYLRAIGRRRPVIGFRMPGAAGRAYRDGRNLTLNVLADSCTWEEHLARLVPAGAPA